MPTFHTTKILGDLTITGDTYLKDINVKDIISSGILTIPQLNLNDINTQLTQNDSYGSLKITTPSGYISIGSNNTTWAHFYTDRPEEKTGRAPAKNRGTPGTDSKFGKDPSFQKISCCLTARLLSLS